jgi:hypothetical protein
VPTVVDGKPFYGAPPHIVHVSDLSRSAGALAIDAAVLKQPAQYTKLGVAERRYVDDYLASLGLDYARVSTDGDARIEANVAYFKRMAETYHPSPFMGVDDSGLFGGESTPPRDGTTINEHGDMRMVFSAGTSANYAAIMVKLGCRDQLISYWELKDRKGFDLAEYVRTGLLPERKNKVTKKPSKVRGVDVVVAPKLPKRRAKPVGWKGLQYGT